jgi:ComF family protein
MTLSVRAPVALIQVLADALFPPSCPACRAETASGHNLCPACWTATEFLSGPGCTACGRPIPGLATPEPGLRCDTCQAHPPAWDRGAAVFAYDGPGRRLVLGLKHGDRLDMLPMLAPWMLRAGRQLATEADLILPVPMHWTRRLGRRFNQSAELARALARAAGKPRAFAPHLLRRARRTASQDGRDRAARAANIKDAICPARGADLTGRRVLLIDDVLTTGATLNAAAMACREAGAAGVDILVLALVSFDELPYFRTG